jgi:hypothetical protein
MFWGVSKLDIRLNDLRKRLLQQAAAAAGAESAAPAPVVRARDLAAATQTRQDSPEAVDPETRIYSVRRLLQNFSPEMEPVDESGAAAHTPPENGSAATAGPSANDEAPATRGEAPATRGEAPAGTEGLSGAILDYVAKSEASEYQLFQAVSKIFEQTKALQDRLAKLPLEYEPIEKLGRSVAVVFGPLEAFQKQVKQLARAFEPMRTIQTQVAHLAQNFIPAKALEQQLENLAGAFEIHLGLLVKALEPAIEIQNRAEQLVKLLQPAQTLQEEFTRLAGMFISEPTSQADPAASVEPSDGVKAPEEPPVPGSA